MLKRLLKPTAFKLALLIGVVFAGGHLFWRVSNSDLKVFKLLEAWEASALDAKFRLRGPVESSHQVTVCGLDEASIQRYGLWPWRRDLTGRAFKNLNDGGARAVGVDMWFSDPDRTSAHRTVNKLIDDALARIPAADGEAAEGPRFAELKAVLEAARSSDPDEAFAAALKESPRVVLGGTGLLASDVSKIPQEIRDRDERLAARFMLKSVYGYDVDPEGHPLHDWSALFRQKPSQLTALQTINGVQISLPMLVEASAHLGLVDTNEDPDGHIRRYAPLSLLHDGLVPSLALATAAVAYDAKLIPLYSHMYPDSIDFVGLMTEPPAPPLHRQLPVEAKTGRFIINYPGSYAAVVNGRPLYERISLADAVDNTFDKDKVKDKIVLVGATAAGTFDQRVTPFDSFAPGVYTHAAVIDNILTQDFLIQTTGLALVEVLVLLLMAVAFGLVIPRFEAYYWQILFMLVMGGAYVALDFAMFRRGIVLATVVPLAETATLFVGLMVFKLVITDREKRQVRTAFQHYLAPSVLEDMVKNPDKLKLGGEKRELTVFFSDIRGFTTISERLPADELARLLNEYLTPMSNLVFEHQGTLDKYMGDAIMAFWGAPMEQPDHALRACTAAVRMLKELDELRAQWKAAGRPDIQIGIGLNSGPMSVGNMGSNMFFNYTVMGDNVNLGSRLEGTNKVYGTKIIMSEFTYARVKGQVASRELGSVRVKGKKLPVGIYELRGIGAPPPAESAVIADFEAGIAAYRARQWDGAEAAFRRVLGAWKDDGPSVKYLEDVADKKKTPPPEGWDGVYEMKTK